MTTTTTAIPTYGNAVFDKGILYGLSWFKTGDWPDVPPTAQQIVAFIKENILEPVAEGQSDEERILDNAGFLVGWIIGQYITQ